MLRMNPLAGVGKPLNDGSSSLQVSERFMAPFARQDSNNTVVGIDAEGFVQRLLLFEQYIVPSIWLKDIQVLLRMVDPKALCEMIDSGAIRFYIDSATPVEVGQTRAGLKLTGNSTHLQDNEFSFATLKTKEEPAKVLNAITELAATEGVAKKDAVAVAERVEAAMLEPQGLQILASSFKAFYADLRLADSTLISDLIAQSLKKVGVKPVGLKVVVEEFVTEDFRVNSNLTTKFGLTSEIARAITLRALIDLCSVHGRVGHMNHFSCLLGMSEAEQFSWELKVDSLTRRFTQESQRQDQFTRVARIAGIGEQQFISGKTLDLRRLIEVRRSDDLKVFKVWLKGTDGKSDLEIRERTSEVRGKIGNAIQNDRGRAIRLMLSKLPSLIPNPFESQVLDLLYSVTDSFLLERIFPKDAVLGILGTEYPALFKK